MSAEQRLELIYKGVQDIKIELARHIVHQEQQRKDIDELKKKVESLEGNQNKAVGVLTITGIAGTAFFAWLFKHF
ncbi:MAG: hypothetical protein V4608_10915 [Bacteroidota bacterium]